MILNTWIPELDVLFDALVEALERGASVSILLLHPDSHIARLRNLALHGSTQVRLREDRVRSGVRHRLEVLAAIAAAVGEATGGTCGYGSTTRSRHSRSTAWTTARSSASSSTASWPSSPRRSRCTDRTR